MPVLPQISVTQSTVPATKASTATNASAWADALATTQAAPQNKATGVESAPPAPKRNGESKKEAGQVLSATTDGVVSLKTDLKKTAKPQSIYIPPGHTPNEKKAAVLVVAPATQAQPVAEKPVASGNAKTSGEARQETNHATADVKADTAPSTASENLLGGSAVLTKTRPAVTAEPKSAATAPAQTATKTETAVVPAPSATNAKPSLADISSTTASSAHAISAVTQSAMTAGNMKAVARPAAGPLVTASTAQTITARATTLSDNTAATPKEKEEINNPQIVALGGISPSSPGFSVTTASNSTLTEVSSVVANPITGPAALAATVTALHQSGQAGTVLRLDPPGLGHLSVEIRLGTQGQVNVLFVPSTADAAQAIQANLPGLGAAMAQSGLTLGQAQLGGQFSQQSGQNGQGGYTPPRQNSANNFAAEPQTTPGGLSAYA
ncbi:MAG: flagellar hook-length control protein FliK [Rhodospirillales bacterium]|nr:flagellar hook-length control protein FliK [Rhodospirillales bacterium]